MFLYYFMQTQYIQSFTWQLINKTPVNLNCESNRYNITRDEANAFYDALYIKSVKSIHNNLILPNL